ESRDLRPRPQRRARPRRRGARRGGAGGRGMKIAVGSRPDWPASVKAAREAAAKLRNAGHEIVEVALDGSAVATAKGATVACVFGGDGTMLRVAGAPLIVYWADGRIVATPTGSTAYGFSVGGPLILPGSRAITMVPIAPHLSFGNAVVFDPDQVLEIEVQDSPARLSLDGQEEHDLHEGDRITVRRSETVAKLVRTAHAKPFVELLRQKILKEPGT